MAKIIKAKFPSTCAICLQAIEPEQDIADTGARGPKGGKRMAHVACIQSGRPVVPAEAMPKRAPEPDPDPYQVRYVGRGPRGGPWVVGTRSTDFGFPTQEAAQAAADKKRAKAEAKVAAVAGAGTSGRWGLPQRRGWSREELARYQEALLPQIQRLQGAGYTQVEIMRLLDRANPDTLPYVERMLDRMLERQTFDERQAMDARHLNLMGFNKPDSFTAEKLKRELVGGGTDLERMARALPTPESERRSREIQYELSALLAKYSGGQLLDIMNKGAAERGFAVRTNPTKRAAPRAKARRAAQTEDTYWVTPRTGPMVQVRAKSPADAVRVARDLGYEIPRAREPGYRWRGFEKDSDFAQRSRYSGGLLTPEAEENPEVGWQRAYNNGKTGIADPWPAWTREYGEKPHLAHWTSAPEYVYEQFYRENPSYTKEEARQKLIGYGFPSRIENLDPEPEPRAALGRRGLQYKGPSSYRVEVVDVTRRIKRRKLPYKSPYGADWIIQRRKHKARQNSTFKVFHADHGISPAQMEHIQGVLGAEAPQGFFIRQITVPGFVPSALYGPAAGDPPVPENQVHYMDRAGRGWQDRMIDQPPRPVDYVQAIGIRDGDAFTLFTVYGGPLAPQNPADPGNRDPEAARQWWSQHALSSHQWAAAKPNRRGLPIPSENHAIHHFKGYFASGHPPVVVRARTKEEARQKLRSYGFPSHIENLGSAPTAWQNQGFARAVRAEMPDNAGPYWPDMYPYGAFGFPAEYTTEPEAKKNTRKPRRKKAAAEVIEVGVPAAPRPGLLGPRRVHGLEPLSVPVEASIRDQSNNDLANYVDLTEFRMKGWKKVGNFDLSAYWQAHLDVAKDEVKRRKAAGKWKDTRRVKVKRKGLKGLANPGPRGGL